MLKNVYGFVNHYGVIIKPQDEVMTQEQVRHAKCILQHEKDGMMKVVKDKRGELAAIDGYAHADAYLDEAAQHYTNEREKKSCTG